MPSTGEAWDLVVGCCSTIGSYIVEHRSPWYVLVPYLVTSNTGVGGGGGGGVNDWYGGRLLMTSQSTCELDVLISPIEYCSQRRHEVLLLHNALLWAHGRAKKPILEHQSPLNLNLCKWWVFVPLLDSVSPSCCTFLQYYFSWKCIKSIRRIKDCLLLMLLGNKGLYRPFLHER